MTTKLGAAQRIIKNLFRLRYAYQMHVKHMCPVIVWQMGKVGSRTIVDTLKATKYPGPVYHVHVLSDALIFKGEVYRRSRMLGNDEYIRNIALREFFVSTRDRGWKIVSLVRDPVARNISAFFQNLSLYLPGYGGNSHIESLSVDKVIEVFFSEFDHDRPLVWFDYEVKGVASIDVFEKPFDAEKGYDIFGFDGRTILVIRIEDLGRVGIEALNGYLQYPVRSMVVANTANNKPYSDLYREFLKKVRFSNDYLDRVYNSRFCRHFYTETEREKMYEKWRSRNK